MTVLKTIIDLLKKHEGFKAYPYRCTAGKLTYGYGRNLDDVGLSEDEAAYLLLNDIKRSEKDLVHVFDVELLDALSENRYSVLVNMMFNLGLTRFRGFKKMIQAIKNNDWIEAAGQMLDSKWAKQVKGRAYDLALMMERG